MRKRRADELGLETPDLVPPPARHELWKAARTKSNGQFTSQSAQEISQRIVSGNFYLIAIETGSNEFKEEYMDTVVVELGRASVYGFLEPQTIQPSGNTLDSRKSYIQTWMTESNREIYIAPYIDAGHWQPMAIMSKKAQVVWFCSLHSKIKAELKSLIQTVMTRTRGQQLEIIYPKCNKHNDSWSCGYYIISWMKAIIRAEIRGEWTERFNTTSPLSTSVITTIREDWARYLNKHFK
ncbi:hypothetical protein LR48_Vigan07g117100 [Vigna angularis]|uniref:Ubiquitin-like protease family profile domain-containing protein n=1 Tax=Phaseolus angularis TaxID=3914 RepID=A0A0L9UY23_PHAAN|nr:hypothetical protein LR48_Vigan07g117100 [Vigna angularis]